MFAGASWTLRMEATFECMETKLSLWGLQSYWACSGLHVSRLTLLLVSATLIWVVCFMHPRLILTDSFSYCAAGTQNRSDSFPSAFGLCLGLKLQCRVETCYNAHLTPMPGEHIRYSGVGPPICLTSFLCSSLGIKVSSFVQCCLSKKQHGFYMALIYDHTFLRTVFDFKNIHVLISASLLINCTVVRKITCFSGALSFLHRIIIVPLLRFLCGGQMKCLSV